MAAAPPSCRIEPLGDRHDRSGFACGVEPLDRYLRQQASQDMRRRLASCFVAVTDEGQAVVGYYTLSATSIVAMDLPPDLVRRLPRYPAIPATLMGRLALDERRRGQHLGELLMFDAFSRTLRSEIATFAFVVDAKDDNARAFYERYRFLPLTQAGRRLYLPVAEIAKLFA